MRDILDDRIHDEEKCDTCDRSRRMSDERDPWCESESNVDDEEHTDLPSSWISDTIECDPEICEYRHTESTNPDSIRLRCEVVECYHIHYRRDDEECDKSDTSKDRLEDRSCRVEKIRIHHEVEDIPMDELVESDLFGEVHVIPFCEEFSVHPILYEPLVGPDNDRDDH
jgi:hypothetical protein